MSSLSTIALLVLMALIIGFIVGHMRGYIDGWRYARKHRDWLFYGEDAPAITGPVQERPLEQWERELDDIMERAWKHTP